MSRYETLILSAPDVTNDEFGQIEKAISKTIQEAKGSLVSFERWGKFRLAYPVRKNDYGIYCLIRFEIDEAQKAELLKVLNTLFTIKFGDAIMRTITTILGPKKSLAYHRPDSLEDTPVRDVDTFLKENKMDSLRGGRPNLRVEDDDEEHSETSDISTATERFGRESAGVAAAATPPAEA